MLKRARLRETHRAVAKGPVILRDFIDRHQERREGRPLPRTCRFIQRIEMGATARRLDIPDRSPSMPEPVSNISGSTRAATSATASPPTMN